MSLDIVLFQCMYTPVQLVFTSVGENLILDIELDFGVFKSV